MADSKNPRLGTTDDSQEVGTVNISDDRAQNTGTEGNFNTQNIGRKGGETRIGSPQNQVGMNAERRGAGNLTELPDELDTDSDTLGLRNR